MTDLDAVARRRIVDRVWDDLVDDGVPLIWDLMLSVPGPASSIRQQWTYCGPDLPTVEELDQAGKEREA